MSDPPSDRPVELFAPKTLPAEPTAPPVSEPRRSGSAFRYALPAAVLILVVGVIAWITQFMPNWRSRKDNQPSVAVTSSAPKALRFALKKAVWDPEDEAYALEAERGHDGHFDFPFENVAGQTAEIGLIERKCDCSHLDVCLLPAAEWERYREEIQKNPMTAKPGEWTFTKVAESDTKGFEVPAGAKGLVRLAWQGRKGPGSRLNLGVKVWHQPLGNLGQRDFDDLEVPIMMAAPLMYIPPRVDVGTLVARASAEAEFTLWSATRPSFELEWGDSLDPRFGYAKKLLSPEECRDLEKKLRKEGGNTRVRKAYRFQVTVREQADGKQLDQGPFHHDVTFVLDDDKLRGPQVLGISKGDIIVGNTLDRGKVNMEIFRAREGKERVVSLWAENGVDLEPESQTPATLQVKLEKSDKTAARTKWLLHVTVPPNTQFGVFGEDSVIILRTKTTPPRFIRIPVTGNGQQS
jgi:hypothetical protein